MKPTWIFSDFKRNDDDIKNIKKYLTDNDYNIVELGNIYEYDKNELEHIQKDFCCIIMGTINMCQILKKDYPKWIPGAIGYGNPSYDCKNYYPKLEKWLLNKNNVIITIQYLKDNFDNIYNQYGISDTIFVRPCDNDKSFVGKLLFKEYFEKDIDNLGNDNLEIIVAEPISILGEWRFVICDGIPIAASMYRMNGQAIRLEGASDNAWNLAKEVSSQFNPDRVWILDLCQAKYDNNYYVLEIGGFSGSGLYNCNVTQVVENVSNIAEKLYMKRGINGHFNTSR